MPASPQGASADEALSVLGWGPEPSGEGNKLWPGARGPAVGGGQN